MKLPDLVQRLKAASAPLDATPLQDAAERAARAATAASGGRMSFHVTKTAHGVQVMGYGLTPDGIIDPNVSPALLQEALDREMSRVRQEMTTQARRRLTS